MIITTHQLELLLPGNICIDQWCTSLNKFLPTYEINTHMRVSAFIAQCSHESGNFRFLKENLMYRTEGLRKVFPKYFPTDDFAAQYARMPEKIANRVYANRMGNGDENSGDGYRFRGRGLIQITGRNNYTLFADFIQKPLAITTEYVETFDGAVESACWFWKTNNLNKYADVGDILGMTKRINGGTIGLEERTKKYNDALKILNQ